MTVFALTIFLGAFLLFQIQPIMGRMILPLFGGSAAVWTTCLLFFQTMLLAGYAHAHGLSTRLGRRGQTTAHVLLLAGSLVMLLGRPNLLAEDPDPADWPIPRILLLLAVAIGLPYFMLAATSPLCQRWFAWVAPRKSPYRLYALSNVGSLLALVSYPALVEPHLPMAAQIRIWNVLYGVFVIGCGICAWKARSSALSSPPSGDPAPGVGTDRSAPSLGDTLEWVGLAAAGSALLLATSNQICLEVASFPFLWIVPLAVYLTTFILCFESDATYSRVGFGALLLLCGPCAVQLLLKPHDAPMAVQIFAYNAILFTACMCCHGELVRAKPPPNHLTRFYLAMATGGAMGGLLVAVMAPILFESFFEYNLAVALAILSVFLAWFRHARWRDKLEQPLVLWLPLALYSIVLGLLLALQPLTYQGGRVAKARNFFGVLTVQHVVPDDPFYTYRVMKHGSIVHGRQQMSDVLSMEPTTYFGSGSGPDLAFTFHPKRLRRQGDEQSLSVGVVGLGTGTVAAYGRCGDRIRFYEINPAVVDQAQVHFTYLAESPADIDIVLGDARLSLLREQQERPEDGFDLLILDAYSSDAVPIHLLTREAFTLYLDRLASDGLLVMHISNKYLNLARVVRSLTEIDRLHLGYFETRRRGWHSASSWVICSRDNSFFESPPVQAARRDWPTDSLPALVWTDDYASLWSVMRWWKVY